jgi:membrane-bound ClpP family serine protease
MNRFLDWLGEFFSERGGLLPLLGMALILINLILQFVPGPGSGWLVDSNLLLHVGLLVSLFGLLLIRVL